MTSFDTMPGASIGMSTAGVWRDDNLAAVVRCEKRYDSLPGAAVQVEPLAVTA